MEFCVTVKDFCSLGSDFLLTLEKAVAYFETSDQIGDNEEALLLQRSSCKTFCHYVNAINTAPRNIGKDGKFQILVCLGTRYLTALLYICLLH